MSEILKADFRNARIGDRVKCIIFGDGVFFSLCESGGLPFIVEFNDGRRSYTRDGRNIEGANNTLFYPFEGQFPTIEACKRQLPKIEVDEKVLVWGNYTKTWLKRYFKYFDTNDYLCVFENGATSWSTDSYDSKHFKYWKLASDETINSGNLHEIEGKNE